MSNDTSAQALTFADLRAANTARQDYWGGSDNWTLADWSNALAGEVGEACNVVKKIRRPQLGTIGNAADAPAYHKQLESEIGDVLIYLDLLAKAAGLDLSECVMRAFNEKSEKLNMPVRLSALPDAVPSEGVRVKALEWQHFPESNVGSEEWIGHGVCDFHALVSKRKTGWQLFGMQPSMTLEDAKAAAQAHYDAAIKSALIDGGKP